MLTEARKASRSVNGTAPWSAVIAAAAAAFRPITDVKRTALLRAAAGACTVLAHTPVPMRPKRRLW
jgi:hypothetical protein